MTSKFRFNHLGVAVRDLESAIDSNRSLFGFEVTAGPFEDPTQEARVVFLAMPEGSSGESGRLVVELISPLGEASHVARVADRGAGAYHVCYEVDDIEGTLEELRGGGCLIVAPPVPAVAYQGRRIAWFYTPSRQLVELVEASS